MSTTRRTLSVLKRSDLASVTTSSPSGDMLRSPVTLMAPRRLQARPDWLGSEKKSFCSRSVTGRSKSDT